MQLDSLSDDALLLNLSALVRERNRINATILAYLIEVEDRRLHLQLALPSLFAFCKAKLGMSEGEAYRRMRAAQIVRRFPPLLEALATGRIHLSNLLVLDPLLTTENYEQLVEAAAGRSKRQVQELVAQLAPRPVPEGGDAAFAHVLPIGPDRYEVRFIAPTAVAEKIARAQALLRHRIPRGDLAAVIEASLDTLIGKVEKQKFGKTERPRAKARPSAHPDHISQATRREVVARDGARCSFVGRDGARCSEESFLELDHRRPRARGGSGEASNARILCRRHNQFAAEQIFGRTHMGAARARACARANAEPAAQSPLEQGPRKTISNALVLGLQFPPTEARRAVAALDPRGWDRPLPELLREALAILT